jgi:hypothetical protein
MNRPTVSFQDLTGLLSPASRKRLTLGRKNVSGGALLNGMVYIEDFVEWHDSEVVHRSDYLTITVCQLHIAVRLPHTCS